MTKEEKMNLLCQLAYLDIPPIKDIIEEEINNVRDLAQYYIDNPDELHQQGEKKEIPCMMSEGEWIETLTFITKEETFADYKVKEVVNHGDSNGLYAYCLVDEMNKNAIFAFRGSEDFTSNWNDWDDNITGMFRQDSVQQAAAFAFTMEQLEQLGEGYAVETVGHSKGGNLAQYVAVLLAVNNIMVRGCYSYDGQGFSDLFMRDAANSLAIHRLTNKIFLYEGYKDVVSDLGNKLRKPIIIQTKDIDSIIYLLHHKPNLFLGEGGHMLPIISPKDKLVIYLRQVLADVINSMEIDFNGEAGIKYDLMNEVDNVIFDISGIMRGALPALCNDAASMLSGMHYAPASASPISEVLQLVSEHSLELERHKDDLRTYRKHCNELETDFISALSKCSLSSIATAT